jgi:drug/metabolite transporter (DMT)-like permease
MKSFSRLSGPVRGAIWMILGGASLVAMAADVRYLTPKFSILEMIFLRSVISLCLILPWALKSGAAALKTRRAGLHVFRNVIHYLGNLGWFLGVVLVPLADVAALQFTIPLFLVVMAALILRENIGAHRWWATAIGFAGMLVIVRPGYIPIGIGTAALVFSALFYASSQTATKILSRTDSPNLVLFYMGIVFVPISFVPALYDWVTPGWEDVGPLLVLGITGFTAHFCMIRSLAAADASFVVPFDFLRLPMSALAGYLLFSEQPDTWVWIGASIIFGSAYYSTRRETRVTVSSV